jgi:Protein of unknown function (DUF2569)
MTDILTSTDHKPRIKGAMWLLLVPLVGGVIFDFVFLVTFFSTEVSRSNFQSIISNFLAYRTGANIVGYLLFVLSCSLGTFALDCYLIFAFLRRKKSFPLMFTGIQLLGFLLLGAQGLLAYYLLEIKPIATYKGGAGLGLVIGIIQYLQISPRTRATFVN